jgi:hypothetical protein
MFGGALDDEFANSVVDTLLQGFAGMKAGDGPGALR